MEPQFEKTSEELYNISLIYFCENYDLKDEFVDLILLSDVFLGKTFGFFIAMTHIICLWKPCPARTADHTSMIKFV